LGKWSFSTYFGGLKPYPVEISREAVAGYTACDSISNNFVAYVPPEESLSGNLGLTTFLAHYQLIWYNAWLFASFLAHGILKAFG